MTLPIDWARVAEPQTDGYDTEVTLGFAVAAGYRRRGQAGCPTFLDGAIAIRQDPVLLDYNGCRYAALDHPNIGLAESLLRLWPEAYAQCRTILDTICLYDSQQLGPDMVIGSICGSGSVGFGSIIVTVNHHMGLAEGVVHEMAHHKLRALGVDIENSSRLLLNLPAEMYPSPIRYDCLRPMSAVLHAQYSYTYIAQLDLKVLAKECDTHRAKAIRERSLAVILPKLQHGVETIERYSRTDDHGKRFIEGLLTWCKRVITAGQEDLSANNIATESFLHPLATA